MAGIDHGVPFAVIRMNIHGSAATGARASHFELLWIKRLGLEKRTAIAMPSHLQDFHKRLRWNPNASAIPTELDRSIVEATLSQGLIAAGTSPVPFVQGRDNSVFAALDGLAEHERVAKLAKEMGSVIDRRNGGSTRLTVHNRPFALHQ